MFYPVLFIVVPILVESIDIEKATFHQYRQALWANWVSDISLLYNLSHNCHLVFKDWF